MIKGEKESTRLKHSGSDVGLSSWEVRGANSVRVGIFAALKHFYATHL